MCGLAGFAGLPGEPHRPLLREMGRPLAHRGPGRRRLLRRRDGRAGRPPTVHHRPPGRPSADDERGRHAAPRLQWRDLQLQGVTGRAGGARSHAADGEQHRGRRPSLRRGRRAAAPWNVRVRPRRPDPAAAPARAGSDRHQAAVLLARGRRLLFENETVTVKRSGTCLTPSPARPTAAHWRRSAARSCATRSDPVPAGERPAPRSRTVPA